MHVRADDGTSDWNEKFTRASTAPFWSSVM
jgi:hypothetical protein